MAEIEERVLEMFKEKLILSVEYNLESIVQVHLKIKREPSV